MRRSLSRAFGSFSQYLTAHGRLEPAQRMAERAVAVVPEGERRFVRDARCLLAEVHMKRDDPARALEVLAPVLDWGLDKPEVAAVAAQAARLLGDHEAAARYLELGLEHHPRHRLLEALRRRE